MTRLLALEHFGEVGAAVKDAAAPSPPPSPPPPPPPDEEQPLYRKGFAAGAAAARVEVDAAAAAALAGFLEAAAGECVRRSSEAAAARAAALGGLRAILRRLRPALAATGGVDEIVAALRPYLEDDANDQLRLFAPEALVEPLKARLVEARFEGATLEILSDPTLSGVQARLAWRDGLASVDLEAVDAAIVAALEAAAPNPSSADDADTLTDAAPSDAAETTEP